jgi:oxaloacetate decarboxylase gamma subunit
MEEMSLVAEGLKFMTLGMGTVFIFLILMIVVLNLQASLIKKFFPHTAIPHKRDDSSEKKDLDEEKRVVAAIVGAVSSYRKG